MGYREEIEKASKIEEERKQKEEVDVKKKAEQEAKSKASEDKKPGNSTGKVVKNKEEESIHYPRFKEELEKRKAMEAKTDALHQQIVMLTQCTDLSRVKEQEKQHLRQCLQNLLWLCLITPA